MDEKRFDRLESKIDKLTEVVAQVVRVEEQLSNVSHRQDDLDRRLINNEQEIKSLTNLATSASKITDAINKLFWIVVAAAIAYGLTQL